MERYETLQKLATGSYGVVYLCKDKRCPQGSTVAVKVFLQANRHPQVLKSAVREAALLQKCKGQKHIVQLHQAYRSESGRVYLVMEYIPHVLSGVIAGNAALGMPKALFWDILKQLLLAIKFLHKQQIIHRDLKPANLMLTDSGVLKVIDLGLARQCRPHQDSLTEYVQTRWYRPPEILVGAPYGFEVDIWAVGCIAAEMVTCMPLFPGKSHLDQLQLLIKCFGTLPRRFMSSCKDLFSGGELRMPREGEAKGLVAKLPKSLPAEVLEVITSCLQLDPLRRPTAEELLRLPQFNIPARFEQSASGKTVFPSPSDVTRTNVCHMAVPSQHAPEVSTIIPSLKLDPAKEQLPPIKSNANSLRQSAGASAEVRAILPIIETRRISECGLHQHGGGGGLQCGSVSVYPGSYHPERGLIIEGSNNSKPLHGQAVGEAGQGRNPASTKCLKVSSLGKSFQEVSLTEEVEDSDQRQHALTPPGAPIPPVEVGRDGKTGAGGAGQPGTAILGDQGGGGGGAGARGAAVTAATFALSNTPNMGTPDFNVKAAAPRLGALVGQCMGYTRSSLPGMNTENANEHRNPRHSISGMTLQLTDTEKEALRLRVSSNSSYADRMEARASFTAYGFGRMSCNGFTEPSSHQQLYKSVATVVQADHRMSLTGHSDLSPSILTDSILMANGDTAPASLPNCGGQHRFGWAASRLSCAGNGDFGSFTPNIVSQDCSNIDGSGGAPHRVEEGCAAMASDAGYQSLPRPVGQTTNLPRHLWCLKPQ